jgi:alkylation response protein AidB-like acyl-CoA dehydrogenase
LMGFDLEPTEEQRVLRETVHDFAARVIRPAARPCESSRMTAPEIVAQVHEIGVTAPVAESFGGGGTLDAVTYCIAAEELAWGDPGIAYQVLGSGLAAILIDLAGTQELKTRHLGRFAESQPLPSFVAFAEKLAAGDAAAFDARIEGDKVIGEKYGVLNAPEAALGIVLGRNDDGLGAVLLEAGDWEIVRPEDKMGLEAAPTWVVRFDAAGEALSQGPALGSALAWIKLMTGAIAVGCARAALEYATTYATEREAFGKPIGAFQGVSFPIADMAIAVDSARVGLWRTAWSIDAGEATPGDIAGAVGQALSAAVQCGDASVQVLGGHGYIRDHPVEKWFRDAVTLSVFDAPEVLGDLLVTRGSA